MKDLPSSYFRNKVNKAFQCKENMTFVQRKQVILYFIARLFYVFHYNCILTLKLTALQSKITFDNCITTHQEEN